MEPVSIPYERERALQVDGLYLVAGEVEQVSIPYERERALQEILRRPLVDRSLTSFNSLRTGKGIARYPIGGLEGVDYKKFQFPTNGKGHCKRSGTPFCLLEAHVSIPYERERALQVTTVIANKKTTVEVSIPYERERALQDK